MDPAIICLWWRAARPFSFTVSIFPPLIGTILAGYQIGFWKLSWINSIICVLGCLVAHGAANLLSDYFDYLKDVDRDETFGSSRVLVEKLLTPQQVLIGAVIGYLIAGSIGLYFIISITDGYSLIWLIALGAFLGIFYTAGPFEIKYHALGDIAVFIAFGSAMSLGAYFVQVGEFSWKPALYIVPLGFLVDAILHSNNIRDLNHDVEVGIKTLAVVIGERMAQKMYYFLIGAAYLVTLVLVVFVDLPKLSLLVFLSIPLAIKVVRKVQGKHEMLAKQFASIDAETAQFHALFAILLILGLVINYFYPI